MITRHQTQYLAWQLASAIVDARIDLNPHQALGIGHINGLSRVDILADCSARTCGPVEVSIYCTENPVCGVEHVIPIRSILNERAQALVPCGFPGFLASGLMLVWKPSQRKVTTFQVALWSVAPAMAEPAFPVLSGAGESVSDR